MCSFGSHFKIISQSHHLQRNRRMRKGGKKGREEERKEEERKKREKEERGGKKTNSKISSRKITKITSFFSKRNNGLDGKRRRVSCVDFMWV